MPKVQYLSRRTDNCRGCPLYKKHGVRTTHVPTEVIINDPKRAEIDVLFLGEAPGETEDAEGRPLIGKSGTLYRKALRNVLGDKEDKFNYAITNVVRCRPIHGNENRQPTEEERSRCVKYTLQDVDKLKPDLVATMGGIAAGAFLPKFRSVAAIRGVPQKINNKLEGYKFNLFPTYHPSAVGRNPYLLSYFKEDLGRITGKINMKKWSYKGSVKTLDSVELVEKFAHILRHKLSKKDIVAVDVETSNGLDRVNNSITSIAFAFNGRKGFVIPMDLKDAPWSPDEFKKVKKILAKLFTDEVSFGYWLAHNAVFELQQIHLSIGVWIDSAPVLDTMHMLYFRDENRLTIKDQVSAYGLKQAAYECLGFPHYKDEDRGGDRGKAIAKKSYRELLDYNAMDAYVTWRLCRWIKKNVGSYWPDLFRLSAKLGAEVSFMFANVEVNGFKIDVDNLVKLRSSHGPIEQAMEKIEEWFKRFKPAQKVNRKLAHVQSGAMNPLFGSPWVLDISKKAHQVALFIKELNLEPLGEGKDGVPSIDKAFLSKYKAKVPEELKTDDEITKFLNEKCTPAQQAVYWLAEYVGLSKLKSSYVSSIDEFISSSPECRDGRIRSNFGFTNTVTGRPVSYDPNLQQVPKGDTPYKKAIKNLFTVEPGKVLISTDYSQGEVYLLAHIAQDKAFAKLLWNMKKIRDEYFNDPSPERAKRVTEECDIHRQTAAMMYGLKISKVTKKERQSAKGIVFGLVYGQHVRTLADNLGISVEEAEKLVEKFFSRFPDSRKWLEQAELNAQKLFYAESPTKRRRRFPQLLSNDDAEKGRALRQARNAPIQSYLSDICVHSAARIQRWIHKYKLDWKIVDVVHDAIIAEIPLNQVRQYTVIAERMMTDLSAFEKDFDIKMLVPMVVEFEFGTNYGELTTWDVGDDDIEPIIERTAKKWKERGYPVKHTRQVQFWDEKGHRTDDYYKYVKKAA